MAWVKEQNAQSVKELEARPEFKGLHEKLVAIYNSRDRIPTAAKRGKWLYDFWQDAENPRGVWRRTTMEEYRKKDPAWGDGARRRASSPPTKTRSGCSRARTASSPITRAASSSLFRGGADAAEIREFDAGEEGVREGRLRAQGIEGLGRLARPATRSTWAATSVPAPSRRPATRGK